MDEPNFAELLRTSGSVIRQACQFLNEFLIPEAVDRVNAEFSPARLWKLSREREPLPVHTTQLSSYRTRMGTILEYALSTAIQESLRRRYGDELLLTFAVAHEYPDFYLRDRNLHVRLRIEMKTVDADSDEQAARFDVATSGIDAERDVVIFVAWEWEVFSTPDGGQGERPFIFAHLAAVSSEIAAERDQRLLAIGGRIDDDRVMVPSTKTPGVMVSDPGNYGKLWRIITRARHGAADQSEYVRRFEQFLRRVDEHAVARGSRRRRRFRE